MTDRVFIEAWGYSVIGSRAANEDSFLAAPFVDGEHWLLLVVDGMGGYQGGQEAARRTVTTFEILLGQTVPTARRDRYAWLLEAFHAAREHIRLGASRELSWCNMGVTLVAAVVNATECLHLHAGDCRLYHVREGLCSYVTRDHSVVDLLLEMGHITEEAVATHPMRSMVSSCLGASPRSNLCVDPKWQDTGDVQPAFLALQPHDVLLLCSDGFHRLDRGEELTRFLKKQNQVWAELVPRWVEQRVAEGGDDNATLVLARVGSGTKPP
ncbi:MAG: serine/threonine-protein phosphatase [Magnetococcales bacterium]|nr:serine/threonine-protein phosphatase [Magnetococcales bacterium]